MAQAKHYAPEGLHTITPHLPIKGAAQALEFYQKAFGAEIKNQSPGPVPGSIIHAEIRIGDSAVHLADEMPGSPIKAPPTVGAATALLTLFVPDADALFNRAVAAGARVQMPMGDMFWGDRYGQIVDPFGHVWAIATHQEDLSAEETSKRGQAFFAAMDQGDPLPGKP